MASTKESEIDTKHLEEQGDLPDKVTALEVFDAEEELSKEEQRQVMRRVDLRVSVATGAMFCISLMDRTNLGAASIAGYVLN